MNEKRGPIRKRFPVDLHNLANGRTAIIFLALWLLFVILLQMTDRPLADLAGGETKLDLRFGYDFQTVQTLFNSYGPQGRELYLGNLAIDTLMPLFLALTTVLFIALAFKGASIAALLAIIPIFFFLSDVVENVLLVILVTTFPAIDPGLVRLASAITRPKLIAAMMTYGILILSALVIAGRYARNQLASRQKSRL